MKRLVAFLLILIMCSALCMTVFARDPVYSPEDNPLIPENPETPEVPETPEENPTISPQTGVFDHVRLVWAIGITALIVFACSFTCVVKARAI